MRIAYISGPYRARTHDGVFENIMRARKVAREYWMKGFAVICPHTNTIFMDGCNSFQFSIYEGIESEPVRDTINTFFRIQRCGCAIIIPQFDQGFILEHGACHLDDAVQAEEGEEWGLGCDGPLLQDPPVFEPGTMVDLVGGWHAAGDYNTMNGNICYAAAMMGYAADELGLLDDWDESETKKKRK